ncbi:hypothetical protein LIER_21317 [Lithospermum erythrorhizon]|uniref:Gag-pol polyprotein n=1 Tax=Lithospermum erythrorhizon TaxID=34254 RepID=A0AAV3QT89_LITER
MEGNQKGSSIFRPPRLDGTNYPYWKAKMTTFLRKRLIGPMMKQNFLGNNKALNVIFCAVDVGVFKQISSCMVAKEARWLKRHGKFYRQPTRGLRR